MLISDINKNDCEQNNCQKSYICPNDIITIPRNIYSSLELALPVFSTATRSLKSSTSNLTDTSLDTRKLV